MKLLLVQIPIKTETSQTEYKFSIILLFKLLAIRVINVRDRVNMEPICSSKFVWTGRRIKIITFIIRTTYCWELEQQID